MKLYLLTGWSAHADFHELVVCETHEEADERLRAWKEERDIPHIDGAYPIETIDGYRIIVGEKVSE